MRCAVLGSPIAHSLSPVLHTAAYAALGLADWSYTAVEVDEAGLGAFLDSLDADGPDAAGSGADGPGADGPGEQWRGLSLTMPLKRAVLPLLDEDDELVRRSGVANTVLIDRDGRRGRNTDIGGAAAAIRERTDAPVRKAVVLGGGATAASVLLALADLGCAEATLLVRDPSRAEATLAAVARHPAAPRLRTALLGEAVPAADIVVSTIPSAAQTEAVLAGLRAPVVFEVIYDPWPTPLARAAAERGATLVSGLDLLVHQAVLQVELMTGVSEAPLAAMRAAGERALRERAGRAADDG